MSFLPRISSIPSLGIKSDQTASLFPIAKRACNPRRSVGAPRHLPIKPSALVPGRLSTIMKMELRPRQLCVFLPIFYSPTPNFWFLVGFHMFRLPWERQWFQTLPLVSGNMGTTGHRDNSTRLYILTIYFWSFLGRTREGGAAAAEGVPSPARPLRIPTRLPRGERPFFGAFGPSWWGLKAGSFR